MRAAPSRQLHAKPLRTDPGECTSPGRDFGGGLDEAIAQFRKALPGFGLKLILPPPLPDSTSPLLLSAWRRGDGSVRVHSGSSAKEAVRLLLLSEARARRERRARDICTRCRGIGWYIAAGGIKAICAHTSG